MANAYSSQRGTVRKAKKGGGFTYRTPKKTEAAKRQGKIDRALSRGVGARRATKSEIDAYFG
jgi:hypothetical protein